MRYRGPLASADRPVHLHLGYDGAGPPFDDVVLEREDDGAGPRRSRITGGHHLLDGAVSGRRRLGQQLRGQLSVWLGVDPVDAHVHARTPGLDPMGFQSLRTPWPRGA